MTMQTHDDQGRKRSEEEIEAIEQEAIDLALNDCQMWGNLPEWARDSYRDAALEG